MATYLHPGVYVEEIPSGSRPIEAVGTSIAAFVGYTEKGPLDDPTFVSSWDEYEKTFGGVGSFTASDLQDPMGHAAYAFFQNGGSKAYVVRTTSGSPVKSTGPYPSGTATALLTFTAANEGTWGDSLVVRISPRGALPTSLTTGTQVTRFVVEVGTGHDDDFEAFEKFSDVSLTSTDANFIENVVDDGSKLVTVAMSTATGALTSLLAGLQTQFGTQGTPGTPLEISFGSGANGGAPELTDYEDVFTQFLKIRDINFIVLPGQSWPADGSGNDVIAAAISHCEATGSRMVIVDPAPGAELDEETDVTDMSLPTQTYAALYYPWVKVANPFYDADTNPGAERTVLVSPGAFVAGMWAKTDARRGVWKAPAGVEAALLGLAGLEFTVEDAEQDFLNPLGVNALRKLPGYGAVIWGSRTLATKTNPEWRYVPVRRTAIFIEQSIYNGIQWAVFEPNDHRLWSALRANVESFMSGLFRAGAFQGEKASDAFFVRCGLGATMTQDDIDRGQVIALVGFAPLKPAEFVIVRIQQKVGPQ